MHGETKLCYRFVSGGFCIWILYRKNSFKGKQFRLGLV